MNLSITLAPLKTRAGVDPMEFPPSAAPARPPMNHFSNQPHPMPPNYWNKPAPPTHYRKCRPGSIPRRPTLVSAPSGDTKAGGPAAALIAEAASSPLSLETLSRRQIEQLVQTTESQMNSRFSDMWAAFKCAGHAHTHAHDCVSA